MIQTLDCECAHIQKTLEAWKGAYGRIWEFSPSLDRLTIRLSCTDRPGNLHLICSPCVFLRGPIHWDHSDLRVETIDQDGSPHYGVRDASAGVEIICRGLAISENVEPLY
jgi:hypothetical protein